jgi:hypothetical protein
MRFTIEQRHLTDIAGKPVSEPNSLSFFSCEAKDAEDAVRVFAGDHSAELIGNVLRFPGFQAIATMRSPQGVFTLQVAPASQQMSFT